MKDGVESMAGHLRLVSADGCMVDLVEYPDIRFINSVEAFESLERAVAMIVLKKSGAISNEIADHFTRSCVNCKSRIII